MKISKTASTSCTFCDDWLYKNLEMLELSGAQHSVRVCKPCLKELADYQKSQKGEK